MKSSTLIPLHALQPKRAPARLIAMHRARYELPEIDPQLRHESRAWLEARGYSRHADFGPWPPKGKLP